jgi:hypothetical protein
MEFSEEIEMKSIMLVSINSVTLFWYTGNGIIDAMSLVRFEV